MGRTMSNFGELADVVGIDTAVEITATYMDHAWGAAFGIHGMGDMLRDMWLDTKIQIARQIAEITGAEHEFAYYENPEARP